MNRGTTPSRRVELWVSRHNFLQRRLAYIVPFLSLTCCGCFYAPLPASLDVTLLNGTTSKDPIDSGPPALSSYTWYVYGTKHWEDGACHGPDTLLWVFDVDEDGRITRVQCRDVMYLGRRLGSFLGDELLADGAPHGVTNYEDVASYVAESYGHSDGTQIGFSILGQIFYGPFRVAEGVMSNAGELDETGESFTGVMTTLLQTDAAGIGVAFSSGLIPDDVPVPPAEDVAECQIVGTRRILASATWNENSPPPPVLCGPMVLYPTEICPPFSGHEITFPVQVGRPLTIRLTRPLQASRPTLLVDKHNQVDLIPPISCPFYELYGFRSLSLTSDYDLIDPTMGREIASDGMMTLRVIECEPGVVGDYTLTVVQAP